MSLEAYDKSPTLPRLRAPLVLAPDGGPDSTPPSSVGAEIGTMLLGKYRVERVLGEGGMGLVLAVRHTELGALFAMKILVVHGPGRPVAIARFLSEARAAARLMSDHVVRVHDVGELEDGSPYMVMEHLEGRDLESVLSGGGPLHSVDAIEYVLQVLDAIVEAHALGIVHRDLKPSNIFLAERPCGNHSVKVLDFGVSRDIGRPGPHLTQSGCLVGTPHYMSPEQIRAADEVDQRSDIWSLGVVLYELLTDAVPFHGDSVSSVCADVLEGHPVPISTRAPGTPVRLAQIVERCLAHRPEDRFQTALDLALALFEVRASLGEAPKVLTGGALRALSVDESVVSIERSGAPSIVTQWGADRITLPAPLAPPVALGRATSHDPVSSGGMFLGWTDTTRPRRVKRARIAMALLASLPLLIAANLLAARALRPSEASPTTLVSSSAPIASAPSARPPSSGFRKETPPLILDTVSAASSSEPAASLPNSAVPKGPAVATPSKAMPRAPFDAKSRGPARWLPPKRHYEGIH